MEEKKVAVQEKQTKKQVMEEILRFLIVGGGATICDYIVFYIFNLFLLKGLSTNLNLILSTFLGFGTGLIVNWLFSAKFVYHYEKKTNNKQFLMYIVICVIGLGMTEAGILLAKPLYEKVYWTIIIRFDFWKLFFKCLMTGLVLIWNYLGRKFFVFNTNLYQEKNKKL